VSGPVADWGYGTLEAMHAACGGVICDVVVRGSYGNTVQSQWLNIDVNSAVIEMAKVSGLNLVLRDQMNVRKATSFGTGQLLTTSL
jgi:glycerate 2-kinase